FTPPEEKPKNGDPPPPYLLAVTAAGQTIRTPLVPFRTASTKVGRRYARLREADRVVFAAVPNDHNTIFLASAAGHVIHFKLKESNILAGAGVGVMGL